VSFGTVSFECLMQPRQCEIKSVASDTRHAISIVN
jgi:hypothetical protein